MVTLTFFISITSSHSKDNPQIFSCQQPPASGFNRSLNSQQHEPCQFRVPYPNRLARNRLPKGSGCFWTNCDLDRGYEGGRRTTLVSNHCCLIRHVLTLRNHCFSRLAALDYHKNEEVVYEILRESAHTLIPICIRAETEAAARSRRRRTWKYVEKSDAATTKVYT